MYIINEWKQRYEVSIKGREPKDNEELRAGPLNFIRLKVYGHRQGMGYRRLLQKAGDKTMEVFGIFCKFLEISGNQSREKRGALLNEKDGPASISDIAFMLSVPELQIESALNTLVDIGWVLDTKESTKETIQDNAREHNSTQLNSIKGDGSLRKNPEKSGNVATSNPNIQLSIGDLTVNDSIGGEMSKGIKWACNKVLAK